MARRFSCPVEVLRHPDRVAEQIVASGEVYGLSGMTVAEQSKTRVTFLLGLRPLATLADLGYPDEEVHVAVASGGPPEAIPVDERARRWFHRNPGPDGSIDAGALCLWFPRDPRELRWQWDDGLIEFILITHRHLAAEEYARRHAGEWPVEAAPHGDGNHPIQSPELLRYVSEHAA